MVSNKFIIASSALLTTGLLYSLYKYSNYINYVTEPQKEDSKDEENRINKKNQEEILVVGQDLGGTSIKAGIVKGNADVVITRKYTLPGRTPDIVQRTQHEAYIDICEKAAINKDRIIGVGQCVPGVVKQKEGIIVGTVNFVDMCNYPICRNLQEQINKPVILSNDATSAILGEWWLVGKQFNDSNNVPIQNICLITIGTGFGCGIVADGNLILGKGMAGEQGHVVVDFSKNSLPCGCGQSGCIERYSSATGMIQFATNIIINIGDNNGSINTTSLDLSLIGEWLNCFEYIEDTIFNIHTSTFQNLYKKSKDNTLSCEDIYEGYESQDPCCIYLYEVIARRLAYCSINLCRIFDTELILIGGGVATDNTALLDLTNRFFSEYTWKFKRHAVPIICTLLGNNSGFIGASKVVIDELLYSQ